MTRGASVTRHRTLCLAIQAYFTALPARSTSLFFKMSRSIVTRASCYRKRARSICSKLTVLSPAPLSWPVPLIRIVAVWLAVAPLDMRSGSEAALARVVNVFGPARPHYAKTPRSGMLNVLRLARKESSSPATICAGTMGKHNQLYCDQPERPHVSEIKRC